MILLFVIVIFTAASIVMLLKKKTIKVLVITDIICLALILTNRLLFLTAYLSTLNFPCAEAVNTIPWSDDGYLLNIGFRENNGMLVYDSFQGWSEDNHSSFFCIYVEQMDEEQAVKEYKLSVQDGIPVRYTQVYGYNNIISEFISRPDSVSRYYSFYIDGRFIYVREHNQSGSEKLFEADFLSNHLNNTSGE